MKFPEELDPLAVTSVTLNSYYVDNSSHHDIAEDLISRVFPNAKVVWFGDMEDLSSGVLNVSPLPESISDRWEEINSALEDMLPQGRNRGNRRANADNYKDGKFVDPELPEDGELAEPESGFPPSGPPVNG